MPKTKNHHDPGSPHHASKHKHNNNIEMDKVKIKRVKRNKKEVTTGEKIMAGVGVGATLMGGAGAVKPQANNTQFVRTQQGQTGSASEKVKDTLKKIFGATFGIQAAKADDSTDASAVVDSSSVDSSASVDTSAPVDTSAAVDTSAPVDNSTPAPVDTSSPAPVDTSSPVDNTTPVDNSTAVDTSSPAPVDTSAPAAPVDNGTQNTVDNTPVIATSADPLASTEPVIVTNTDPLAPASGTSSSSTTDRAATTDTGTNSTDTSNTGGGSTDASSGGTTTTDRATTSDPLASATGTAGTTSTDRARTSDPLAPAAGTIPTDSNGIAANNANGTFTDASNITYNLVNGTWTPQSGQAAFYSSTTGQTYSGDTPTSQLPADATLYIADNNGGWTPQTSDTTVNRVTSTDRMVLSDTTAKPAPTLTATNNGNTVGINITNAAAGQPVMVTVNGNTFQATDPSTGRPAVTDANGNYSGTYTTPAGMAAGTYNETWSVAGQTAGNNSFSVAAASNGGNTTTITPVNPPTTIFNANSSTGNNTLTVGSNLTINIAGAAANSPVTAQVVGANGQVSTVTVGTTDANGNFNKTFPATADLVGNWGQIWQVGGQTVGTNQFQILGTNNLNPGNAGFSATSNTGNNNLIDGTGTKINITGAAANSPVTVVVTNPDGSLSKIAVTDPATGKPAVTDKNGNYSGTFTVPNGMTAGNYAEVWQVNGQTVGTNSFNIQAPPPAPVTVKNVPINLIASGSEPIVGGGDHSVVDYLTAHPSAAQGTVGVGYGSDGKTITSYTINGITYSPQQLANAIVQVGSQIYNYTAQNGVSSTNVTNGVVSGGQYMGALASLTPAQQAVYFLGTQALALPGAPYVSMSDPNTASAFNQGTVLFYPSAGTTMSITNLKTGTTNTNVFNPSYFSTPADAAQALKQIQKYYPNATLTNATPTSQNIGGVPVVVTNPEGTGTGMYQITIPGGYPINVGYILGQLDANGNLSANGAAIVSAQANNTPIPTSTQGSFKTTYSTGTNTIGTNGTSSTVITGQAPYTPVFVTINGANGQKTIEQVGTTDAGGNFTFNGAASSAIVGNWNETWQVGSKVVGTNSFTVQAPTATTTGVTTGTTTTNTTNGGKTVFSASNSGGTITAGTGTVTINIVGAKAGADVTVLVTNPDGTQTTQTIGQVKADGTFNQTFTAPAGMVSGAYSETWQVGGATVGNNNFVVQGAASGTTTPPVATTTKTVTLNLLASGSEPMVGGGDHSVTDYLAAHPSAAQGSVTVGYGSDGKTIVSYTINGTVYTPQSLADAIVQVGKQVYNYTAQNGVSNTTVTEGMVSGGQYTGALASLTPAQQAVYFLGTQALALPGTPYVSMPDPNTASAQNSGTILFYPSAGTTMTINNAEKGTTNTNVYNPAYFSTPSAAAQALKQIQKYYPEATLTNATPSTQTIGGLPVTVTNPEGTGTGMYQITIPGAAPMNVSYVLGQLDSNGNLSATGAATVYAIATNNVSSNWTPLTTNTGVGGASGSSVATTSGSTTVNKTSQAASITNADAKTAVSLQVSKASVSTQVGAISTVGTEVVNNGQTNRNITAASASSNILVNTNPATGQISVVGLAPGVAKVIVHPTDMGSSTAQDKVIVVTVEQTSAGAAGSANTGGSGAGASGNTGSVGNGTTGGSGTGSGSGTGGSNSGTTNNTSVTSADQQLITQLQGQVQILQSRIDSLTSQLASQSSGNNNSAAQNVASLQGQVNQLTALVQNLQSGQVHAFGSVDGSLVQGLQMQTSNQSASGGLQMPNGYQDSSSGLQMQADGQVQGAQTGSSYTVKKGDTLWSIAKKVYGDGKQWRKILSANPNALSKPGNTKTLKVGFVLTVPN